MSSFSSALQSGQLGPLMKQFDLPEQVSLAAAQGNLEAFGNEKEVGQTGNADFEAAISALRFENTGSSPSDKR